MVIKDYVRAVNGVQLRKPKRKAKRSPAHLAAETRYRATPKGKAVHVKSSATRRAKKQSALATLTAAEHLRINAIYAEAARRTAETGIVHHVDHDVPLALGGLHHPDNLFVVPATINLAKGARYASTWEYLQS